MTTRTHRDSDATLSFLLRDSGALLSVAKSLLAGRRLTAPERQVLAGLAACQDSELVESVRASILEGRDPLGDAYCTIHHSRDRRDFGQTFTPPHVVEAMLGWARRQRKVVNRIVDPGAGTGRYTLAGLRTFPDVQAVAVEKDPVLAVLLRANLCAAGFEERAEIVVGDFRSLQLPRAQGVTLWIGNPPYVRHHDIDASWKAWYAATLKRFGYQGSQLAGLHLHFFLRTLELAREGDIGCYVTAAEWLDVNYGQALRQLLTNGLGGKEVFVIDPTTPVFGDALVSAAITCFEPGSKRTELHFSQVTTGKQLRALARGGAIDVAVAKAEPKWSFLVKGGRPQRPAGFIELGEMFRVSRGQVTGSNRVWVEGAATPTLPARFLVPTITDATDITKAHLSVIDDIARLRRVVCLPPDLQTLGQDEKKAVDRFLAWARSLGAHETYVALHRKPWWSLGFKAAPPIVMTYMGRRPPVFALNPAGAQLINVAHGLYPRQPLGEQRLNDFVKWLNLNVSQEGGRTYAGGLIKFEPSEAMRILVPESIAG